MNSFMIKVFFVLHLILLAGCLLEEKGSDKQLSGVWISNDLDSTVFYEKDGYVFYSESSFCILPLEQISKTSFGIKDTCLLNNNPWGDLYDKIVISDDSLFLFHSSQYSDKVFELAFYPLLLSDEIYEVKSIKLKFSNLTLIENPFQEVFIDFKKLIITDINEEYLFPSSLEWIKRINFNSFQNEYLGYSPPGTYVINLQIETYNFPIKEIKIAGLHYQVPTELKGLIAACYLNAFLLQKNKQ